MKQMKSAVRIAEATYPKSEDYRLFWLFDQSGCHMAFDEDALNINCMNAGPGGSVPCMHDTTYKGKTTYMTKQDRKGGCLVRIPRGLRDVLEQRGRYTHKMKLAEMKKELASHLDFVKEKNRLEYFLHARGHACLFIHKFHSELNPIERCWAQAKRYTRASCHYNINCLRNISHLDWIVYPMRTLQITLEITCMDRSSVLLLIIVLVNFHASLINSFACGSI